jgi:FkbH-like protein
VLVALASKNNPEDVWEVFDKRPDMPLRKEHVVASRINWQDKTSNLRDLAASLNLGLDSFVFIDDSEFEIDLVRHILPEVACILVDASNPGGHARQLADSRHFDTLSVTEQDRKRTASYKAEERRIEIRNSTESLTGYLKSLGMNLEIKRASTDTLNRLSQLTMRTNQFNLTTKRYSERDIAALSESSSHELLQISLTDRFGEYGIIGTAILAHEPFATTVDNFLLSCRALGRGVEYAAFADICKRAKLQGMETLKSTYIATKKNQQTEDFYLRAGMKLECETEGKKEFTLDLNFAIKSQEDQHLAIHSDAQSKEDT